MKRLAFIGLGVMGVPMAANLERAGFAVQSYDLKGNGNRRSGRDAVRGAEAVITMLPDGDAVREAVLEALPAISPGTVVIDMSSSDPFATRALGRVLDSNRIHFLDAPVSGAVVGARDASLAIMVGGEEPVFRKARPVFEAMGKNIFHVGALGAGHAVKALNNYLGAAGTLAGFEALIIARAFGLDPGPMLEAINASTGRNSTTERKIARDVLTGAYASGFKLALMTKDVGIAAALADDLGLRTPFLKETLRAWREARKSLAKDADHSEIYKYQESLARRRSAAGRRKTAPSRGAASRPAKTRRTRRRST
jgi:3-hydroxyisobutyrate dehydrogenase